VLEEMDLMPAAEEITYGQAGYSRSDDRNTLHKFELQLPASSFQLPAFGQELPARTLEARSQELEAMLFFVDRACKKILKSLCFCTSFL
jgi:hypothetical protein